MKYELHVTSIDIFGVDMIENVVRLARDGAVIKVGTLPKLSFPFYTIMEIESKEPPVASASVRVFDENKKEVFAKVLEVKKAAEQGDVVDEISLKFNDSGEYWTKEQLEDLEWEVFKKAVKDGFGITGRDRNKMTTQYINAVSELVKES